MFAFLDFVLGNRKSIAKEWNTRGLGVALERLEQPDHREIGGRNVLSVRAPWLFRPLSARRGNEQFQDLSQADDFARDGHRGPTFVPGSDFSFFTTGEDP
ncbi:MAG: hypothetical protein GY741_00140 [Phycisphaeraceae bacterium]|nr:hypothetical protein [Phycisphaeraceae bacterium]